MATEWNWETASPAERADMVRRHAGGSRPLGTVALADLFQLTDAGVSAILAGDTWRKEYALTPGQQKTRDAMTEPINEDVTAMVRAFNRWSPTTGPDFTYDIVLTDLRQARDRIDRVIQLIENLRPKPNSIGLAPEEPTG